MAEQKTSKQKRPFWKKILAKFVCGLLGHRKKTYYEGGIYPKAVCTRCGSRIDTDYEEEE